MFELKTAASKAADPLLNLKSNTTPYKYSITSLSLALKMLLRELLSIEGPFQNTLLSIHSLPTLAYPVQNVRELEAISTDCE